MNKSLHYRTITIFPKKEDDFTSKNIKDKLYAKNKNKKFIL